MTDWLTLRDAVRAAEKVGPRGASKQHQGRVAMALALLEDLLLALFGRVQLEGFCVGDVPPDAAFFLRVSRVLHEILEKRGWKRATRIRIVALIRRCILPLDTPSPILRALRVAPAPQAYNKILGSKYGHLDFTHPVRRMLEQEWLVRLKRYSKSRAEGSLRNILNFYMNRFLPRCGLTDLTEWPEKKQQLKPIILSNASNRDFMENLCDGRRKKHHWVRLFLHIFLDEPGAEPAPILSVSESRGMIEQDGDIHKFTSDELDLLEQAAQQEGLETELMFMVLVTTGMRIGGFVHMKCADVADLKTEEEEKEEKAPTGSPENPQTKRKGQGRGRAWVCREEGRTLEKGPKWFGFPIYARVQELMAKWLNCVRPTHVQSDYVFPGKFADTPRSQSYYRTKFKAVCRRAGLHGPRCHLHSLRHCFIQMLAACGNSPEVIAGVVGHNDPALTQRFYLRQSALEVTEKAIIPWMPKTLRPKKPILPKFLQPVHEILGCVDFIPAVAPSPADVRQQELQRIDELTRLLKVFNK